MNYLTSEFSMHLNYFQLSNGQRYIYATSATYAHVAETNIDTCNFLQTR